MDIKISKGIECSVIKNVQENHATEPSSLFLNMERRQQQNHGGYMQGSCTKIPIEYGEEQFRERHGAQQKPLDVDDVLKQDESCDETESRLLLTDQRGAGVVSFFQREQHGKEESEQFVEFFWKGDLQ